MAKFIFSIIPWLQHLVLNFFRRIPRKNVNYFWDVSYFRPSNNIQTTKTSLQKIFDVNTLSCKSYLGKEEQKAMCLVVSRWKVQLGTFSFCVPDRTLLEKKLLEKLFCYCITGQNFTWFRFSECYVSFEKNKSEEATTCWLKIPSFYIYQLFTRTSKN